MSAYVASRLVLLSPVLSLPVDEYVTDEWEVNIQSSVTDMEITCICG